VIYTGFKLATHHPYPSAKSQIKTKDFVDSYKRIHIIYRELETFTPETLDAALAPAPVWKAPPAPVPQAYSGADRGDTAPGHKKNIKLKCKNNN